MTRPLVLSTWTFSQLALEPAMAVLKAGGTALDAAVDGATAVELDESVASVGVGGMPDADGQVSLDAMIMTDPDKAAGVAGIRNFGCPTKIAREVMNRTIHTLLVGEGAERFADQCGFLRMPLLNDHARAKWREWVGDHKTFDRKPYAGWIQPRNAEETLRAGNPKLAHDTVCVLTRDTHGALAGACSTSGMAFKVPGRVGDSPIIGHGLYVEQGVGAASATGNGELASGMCASFLAVELMRSGKTVAQAIRIVLERVIERYELSDDHQLAMIAIGPDGSWATAAIRPGFQHGVADDAGVRVEPAQVVLISGDSATG